MKHFNKLRISLLYSILLISSILATEIVMKKTVDTTDNKCGDPCQGILIILFLRMSKSCLSNEIPRIS